MSADGPLTFTLAEAAARLGGPFTADWLRGHLAEIPHVKNGSGRGRGGRVGFTDAHLIRIVEMFSIEPDAPTSTEEFTPITRRKRGFAVLG